MRKSLFFAVAALAALTVPAQANITIKMLKPVVKANIDLSTQRMNVTVNGEQLYTWKISSGRGGYPTPTGSYHPYRIHKMWRSRKYNNAPMPYSVFFRGGYAIHGTTAISRLGRPASHGCVRLHPDNAKKFYELVLAHGRARTQVNLSGAWAYKPSKAKRTVRKRRSIRRGIGRSARQRLRQPSRNRTGFFSLFN